MQILKKYFNGYTGRQYGNGILEFSVSVHPEKTNMDG
jgi:hypothetical protein